MTICYCTTYCAEPGCSCGCHVPDYRLAALRRSRGARVWQMIVWAAGFVVRWREVAPERFR